MKFFLRLKHWQLFLLLIGIPLILQILLMTAFITNSNPNLILHVFQTMMFLMVVVYFGWYYALGTNLYEKLPAGTPMSLIRFKIFLFIPAVYIVLVSLLMLLVLPDFVSSESGSFAPFALIFPIHIFSMYCIFYCLYFISKAMKTAEWQRQVTFSDYAGEFFLFWFFPIGIWIIQPRINKLFEISEETPNIPGSPAAE